MFVKEARRTPGFVFRVLLFQSALLLRRATCFVAAFNASLCP
jgi:hypothetical protein